MANSPINPFLESPFDTVTDKIQQDRFTLPPLPAVSEADQPDATPAKPQPKAKAPSNTRRADDYTPPADLRPVFEAAARTFNVPVNVLMALGHQESRFNPNAIGTPTQWGRAKGMMQYLDDTANRLGINPFDPYEAIPAAAKQIRERFDKGYSIEDAVKAHFAGDDRKLWKDKTAAYGREVLEKAARIADTLYPFDQSPEEVARRDRQRTEIAAQEQYRNIGQPPADVSAVDLPKQKPQRERTWGEVASDTGVQLAEGVNNILGAVPNLVSPEGEVAAFFNRNAEYWNNQQSAPLKAKIEAANAKISEAGKDGILAQMSEAASQYFTDPGLAARFITTNLPSMIPSIGAAKVAQAAALARGATALKAASVATSAAGATNAALNAGGARGDAFNDIKQTLINKGMSEEQATEQALKDSRVVAAVGAVTGYLSGKTGLEHALVGKAGTQSALRAGVGSGVAELVGEQAEEVLPQVTTNYQASQYDNRSLGKDVGHTIVGTAIGTGPGSVLSGGIAARNARSQRQSVVGPSSQQNAAPAKPVQTPAAQAAPSATPTSAPQPATATPSQPYATATPTAPVATVTAPAPSQADGPLTRAVENAAEQPQRVTVTAPEGEISGFVQDILHDDQGNTVTRVLADDGQVYSFSSEEPIQIKPEGGPLTKALEKVASQEAPQIVATGETANDLGVRDVSQPSVEAAAQTGANQQGAGTGDQAGAAVVRGDAGASEPGARAGVSGAYQTADTQPTLTPAQRWRSASKEEAAEIIRLGRVSERYANSDYAAIPDGVRQRIDSGIRRLDEQMGRSAAAQSPDEHAGKWFGSKEKADAYIAKKQAGATHESVQTGKVRWEIKPKAVSTTQETSNGAASKPAEAVFDATPEAPNLAPAPQQNPSVEQSGNPLQDNPASWVIREKSSGKVVMETFDQKKVDALNTDKYEAVPAYLHLTELNNPETLAYKAARGDASGKVDGSAVVKRANPKAEKSAKAKRRGEVGGKLESGEVVLTASGRETTPFPTIKMDTNRKAGSTVKAVDKWLMQNALDEARARGDQFNARQFEANLEKPSQADKDSAEEYLFGQQPEVVPSILRPLVGAEKKDQEAQAQARKSDSNAMTTPEEAAKYLKDFVYSLGNLEGMTDRAQVALSSALGKSGRDTLLMQAFGITREQAHEINNHLDARKPNNLRNEDMQEAFDLFPGLRKIVDGAVQQAAAREAKPTEPTPPTGGKSSDYGADNKLVSRERAAELRDRLKKKLSGSQLNAGIDPEILAIGTELAVFHLEAGARKFAAFAKAIASDLDMPVERLRPYLRSWYNGARDMMEDHGLSVAGMDSAEAVRAELAKMDNKPAATEPIRKTAKVYTPAGREIDVAYTVKEADDLIVSNDDSGRVNPAYPKELQPRDRTRAASDTQIQSIAGNLNPALLGESASTTDGAPIVSKDGVVESGNGRTLAIRRAYEQGNAEAYRKALADMGYNVDGMRRPVLVRERQTEMTPEERRAYTVESNQRTTLAMSASERAMADADQVKAIIDLYRGGDLNSAANRDFVRAFVGRLPDSERADLMDANGLLAQDGRRRIEGALLAAAYGDPSLVAELMESADSDIKSIGGALLDVAANWAQMREDSAAGRIADGLDVTPNLMEAVNLVRRARAEGRPVKELVDQNDIFSGGLDPVTEGFVRLFFRGESMARARGRDRVASALNDYTEQARLSQPGHGLFDDIPPVKSGDLLENARGKLEREEGQTSQQQDIFGSPSSVEQNAGQGGREGPRREPETLRQQTEVSEGRNVPSTDSDLERDRADAATEQPGNGGPVQDGRADDAGNTGAAGEGTGGSRGAGQRDRGVPGSSTVADGERSDQPVYRADGQFEPADGAAGDTDAGRGGVAGGERAAVEQQRAEATLADAPRPDDLASRLTAQKAAGSVKTEWGNRKSIDAALPLLLEPQRDDVLKAETRFDKANGILFTNGTGTGKTATGLGMAKRFYNAGKRNIVVVVPSDKIASDWVKFAGMLDMPLHQLADTTDNGGDKPVVTTYANFSQNPALFERDWDMVIADESHYLSSNENGDSTGALDKLRALTGHPRGFYEAVRGKHPKEWEALVEAQKARSNANGNLDISVDEYARLEAAEQEARAAWEAIEKPARAEWQRRWEQQDNLPKVTFLSATPFAYAKNTDYAEGYLFHYVDPKNAFKETSRGGYNSGGPREQFMMQNFGYRMRYNKLTAPESGVNAELMEQAFNERLQRDGALSGRRLDVPHDYERRFVLVEDAIGKKIDDGLKWLMEAEEGKYRPVYEAVMSNFDYQRRMYLLEAIKAKAAVPHIQQQLDKGRKVVVFHDYNKGGGFHPFADVMQSIADPEVKKLAKAAFNKRPDLLNLNLEGLASPIETLTAAYPDALLFNGTVPKKQRRLNADLFNDDESGRNLIVVQSDAGREGVSLHDTTGKHQRVLVNLGMPTKPVAATQIEGRTYRTGQASDAIFHYLTTGTGWEASAFARKIAERASTAENLALGTEARGLKQSFIDAYGDAAPYQPGENDGKGGKAYDRALSAGQSISPFDRAKTFYYAQQKNSKARQAREGVDYFATPEPVGYKMVEWAGIRDGEKALEPSAGHGAIARFFPPLTDVTMVEPSYDLSQRAALANGNARIVNDRFENLHIGNKYDAIVMNPPYGVGGKTAIEHMEKAAAHLRDGGRMVALIPRGGMAEQRLNQFINDQSANGLYRVATIAMPSATFERAGTSVNTQIVVFDKVKDAEQAPQPRNIDLTGAASVKELFDRIENVELPPRPEKDATQAQDPSTDDQSTQVIEHTTQKGKVIKGVIRSDFTKAEAQAIDPYTFRKDGGWFIREKYLSNPAMQQSEPRYSVDPDGHPVGEFGPITDEYRDDPAAAILTAHTAEEVVARQDAAEAAQREAKKPARKANGEGVKPKKAARTDAEFERQIQLAADSIRELRKVDVDRVLTQDGIDAAALGDYIKRKRPDLAAEVDEVLAEIAGDGTTEQPDTAASDEPRYSVNAEGQAVGEFGPISEEYRDDPAGAVKWLQENRTGEAIVTHPKLGEISLIWGDGKIGLSHIAARRGEDFLNRIPAILQSPEVYEKSNQSGRVFLGNASDEATIRLDWNGQAKAWLVSAYEKHGDMKAAADPRASTRSDVARKRTSRLAVDTLRQEITRGPTGQVIARLIDQGVIVLHKNAETLPKEARSARGVQAVTLADGKIHLVANSLTADTARPVLMHEMFHKGGEALLGSKEWGNLIGRLGSLYRQADLSTGKAREFFDRARDRVAAALAQNAVSTAMTVEEFGAYAIEEWEQKRDSLPAAIRKWVEDFIGQIKAFVLARYGKQLGQVTPAQLAGLAKLALVGVSARADQGRLPPATGKFSTIEQTKTPAFKEWFGNSKVVDENGKPLVVYHGTKGEFTKFDLERAGSKTDSGAWGRGIYFAADPEYAGAYAGRTEGSNIVPAYISLQNPLVVDARERTAAIRGIGLEVPRGDPTPAWSQQFANAVAQRGYDGVIVTLDGAPAEIVAFRPEQIKSAIGNNGEFDPNNPDIRYSVRPEDQFDDLSDKQKSFLSKIGPKSLPQTIKERWQQLTDNLALRVRQAGIDRYAALMENDKALLGDDMLEGSIADSGWVLARMSGAAGGALFAMLNSGRIYLDAKDKVIDIKEGTEGFAKTLARLGSPAEIDRFMGWVAANRARKLLEEGRENLFTPEEIEAAINLSGGKLANGKSRGIAYARAWKEFQQYRDDVLGIAEQSGIISTEQRAVWMEDFYVPFYRVLDEDSIGGPSGSSGLSRQQAVKKLKGGKQNLNDLLENTLMNYHHLLQASLKNQAAVQAVKNAVQLGIAEPTTEGARDKKMSTFVNEGGQKVWYNISDPLTFKALSALSDSGLNTPAMKVGRAFKRFFTNMTTITPQFIIANALRDSLSAMATSPTSAVPFKTAIKGAMTYGNDSDRARMLASGAAYSFGHVYGDNIDDLKASITGAMRNAKVLSDPRIIPRSLMSAWRQYHKAIDLSENMNRAGIWKRELDAGKGKLKAAFEARDMMPFDAHGDAVALRVITDLVPFLNARLQGLDKLYRSGGKPTLLTMFGKGSVADKKAFARFAAVVGALSLASMALFLANWDDDEYRKLEDWQRDTYWVVRVGESMFFIPKPFEVGAIATMSERLLEQFVDQTVGGKKFAQRFGHMLSDTFAFNPIPQVVKPLYEVAANQDTFSGRPIEDQSMQKLSPSLRSRPDTSRLANSVSGAMESLFDVVGAGNAALSPVQIDHLVAAYTGQVGATALATADTLWRSAVGEVPAARRWYEYQPIRRFYKNLADEDGYTRYGTDFYNALKESERAYSDVMSLAKLGEMEKAQERMADKEEEVARYKMLNRVSRNLSKINAEMKRVQVDKTMDAEAKRMQLDRLRGLRNMITENVGKALEQHRLQSGAPITPDTEEE